MTHIHASMESQIEQDKKIVMTRDSILTLK
jgi:hypothetical protein